MLTQLTIENIALIEKLELELKCGLNILSGETGAGKSIIIDSLNFVLGERADKSLIRHGTDYAIVQAVFESFETPEISAYLNDNGIDCEEVLILRRKMTVEGKNECRINGKVSTLSTLKGLSELLVDIHGQHEHQSLLKSSNHVTLLDAIGGDEIAKLKNAVQIAYDKRKGILREINRYGDDDARARKLDVLHYQIEEIERINVQEGEEDELLLARKRIRNMEKILSALTGAKSVLDGYDSQGVSASIKAAQGSLKSIESFDDDIPEIVERLDSAKLEIVDISDTISSMLDALNFDAKSADQLEKRLEDVRNVTRKYGGSYQSLQDFYQNAVEEANTLENASDIVEKLQRDLKNVEKELLSTSQTLTSLRHKVALNFENNMLKELGDLGMGASTFKVQIISTENVEEIGATGGDNVEFLISPNVGEPLKPLAKIISGGEMSRFMLALKNIIAGVDHIGTMVFDEIDTGISGNISQVVSEKMCNISRNRQVIAVTHMPSLAAMADNHYLIAKSTENGKTLTHITLLEDDVDEVARLIGGDGYSQFAIPHAKEMKAWAQRYKDGLK